jgi:predicted adenylyl cyclase CyaB
MNDDAKSGRNIEIKARLHSPQKQRRLATELADQPVEVLRQTDTFFNALSGRLKLREFGDGTGELIAYHRPDTTEPTCSQYTICPTTDPPLLLKALNQSLGILGVVTKTRRLVMRGQTRVHLDEVEGLGHFLELEAVLRPGQTEAEGHVMARQLMASLAVRDEDLIACAYIDLLLRV